MRSFFVRLSRSFCGEGLMEMLKLKIIKTTSRKVFTKVSGTAWNVDYPRLAFHRKSKAIFSSYLWSRLVPQLKNAFAIFHPRLRVLLQRRRSQAKQISIMPESINRKERQSIISRKITWRKSFGAFVLFPRVKVPLTDILKSLAYQTNFTQSHFNEIIWETRGERQRV